jgi:hypothetical protein
MYKVFKVVSTYGSGRDLSYHRGVKIFLFSQDKTPKIKNMLTQNPDNDGPCVDQHEDLGDLLNSSAESKSARVVCAGVPVSLTFQLTRCVTVILASNRITILSRYDTWINSIYEDLSAIR